MQSATGDIVITANNRLARILVGAHDRAMLASGALAWETLRALPFDAFVAEQWSALHERCRESLPRLLGAGQSRALWHEVVARAAAGSVLSTGAAVASAMAARELLLRHEAELQAADCTGNVDAEAFLGWHEAYRQRLREGDWIDLPAAASHLAVRVREFGAGGMSAIRLAGFDRLTAQQSKLMAAYRKAGVEVAEESDPGAPAAPVRVAFATPQDELEAAARWARALLDAGDTGPIGVVVPDLRTRVAALRAVFEDALHPGVTIRPVPEPAARAFNVSLGRPLPRVPVVSDALAVLEVVLGAPGAEAAGRTLLSPYLDGSEREGDARLALEARLRDQGVRSVRTRHLARLAVRGGAAVYARSLERASALTAHPRARLDLAQHARTFAELLSAAGWPRGRTLDSGEYQAAEAFRAVLESLGALAAVSRPCTAKRALALLARELAETTFQPRAATAPVQVLGVLEAVGLRFSHLWMLGFHDRAWPPPETANPFLPMPLQRRHGMPGASPAQALERGRRLTARLLGAAPAAVVSHALADGDEELAASPLVAGARVVAAGELPCSTQVFPDPVLASAAPVLERVADWCARGVGHGWKARGGSRVLTDQAACPFRAFARHRLAATGIERAPAPLDARSRGILAHRLMQNLFKEIGGSGALAALDREARDALAVAAAGDAVASVLRGHPGEVPRRLADAERDRLAALALRWLELEAQRPVFEVESVEQRRSVRIGGLALEIQLDRVDRVDGRRLLLDYKTGRARRAAWFGERPGEPQLPLYALALDADGGVSAPVAGVAFATLRRGQEGFEGIAEEPGWAPGLAALGAGAGAQKEFADMRELKARWGEVLGRLAQAFADGDAAVDPLREACRYCDIRALCRVDAVRAAGALETQDDGS